MSAELGLGTASLLPGYGLAAAGAADGPALVSHALARGVRYLDTAAAYGDSEAVLGAMATAIAAAGARVATKLSVAQLVAGAFGASLARLGADRVDTLLLHSAGAADLERPDVAAAFDGLKSSGLIARAGASTYGAAAARLALAQPWCDAVQIEFSVLNPSVLHAIAPVRRRGQQVIARSVFAKGALTPRRGHAPIPPDAARLLDALDAAAAAWSMTLTQLALRFALDAAGLDIVLTGASTAAEIDAAVDTTAMPPLTAAQLRELAAFDRAGEDWTHPETWKSSPN